jgi:hypothetical protein
LGSFLIFLYFVLAIIEVDNGKGLFVGFDHRMRQPAPPCSTTRTSAVMDEKKKKNFVLSRSS